jgi:hypothetical protein
MKPSDGCVDTYKAGAPLVELCDLFSNVPNTSERIRDHRTNALWDFLFECQSGIL